MPKRNLGLFEVFFYPFVKALLLFLIYNMGQIVPFHKQLPQRYILNVLPTPDYLVFLGEMIYLLHSHLL